MKAVILIFLLLPLACASQELPVSGEQQLEQLADATEAEQEDDSWVQELEIFTKHPLNLNTADKEDLLSLRILNTLQVENFLRYRELLGMLVNRYELQAVPGWDLHTIRLLLPYITISIPGSPVEDTKLLLKKGQHQLVMRAGRVVEKAAGYIDGPGGKAYVGSPWRYFFRYRYTKENRLQMGVVGDKDAGEAFLRYPQKKGFDFLSFHFFIRKAGAVRALALGDFTVSMGQGLIHWQGLAFKKGAQVMNVKRQSAVLRPYSSAGEYLFHRGAGITVGKRKVELTAFASLRKLDANISTGENGHAIVSSIISSGYHRTENEIADQGQLKQLTVGGNIQYREKGWHAGMNVVAYRYSVPVQKRDEAYNYFSWSGRGWWNAGIDYSYTYRNIHLFGEVAMDPQKDAAFINGALFSLAQSMDLSVVHRWISPAYQAIYGNAFTENTQPVNERGFFAGMEIRPVQRVRINMYADVFSFPWLKFRVDAPSRGTEYMIQVSYTPNRQVEWYTRFRWEKKERNATGNSTTTYAVKAIARQSWRTHFSIKLDGAFTVRQRAELLSYDRNGDLPRQGYLLFTDIIYRPPLKPLSASLRYAVFETSDYDARVYAYENDVMYSFSIPALYGRGQRYYITAGYDFNAHWSAWIRLARTVYPGQAKSGTGPDEITGNGKTEFRAQLRWQF